MVGTISIPAISIEYPILEKVTTKSLKVAIVYLTGPGINKVGNTVLQGHNYRNGTMFSNLEKLKNGDKIYITDESKTKVTYEVYDNFSAEATDTSFYNRDTAGLREVTLSTCTNDSVIRTIILAKEVKE
ncbi:MAG: sortase [Clostridia bacterium]|nr:sortase [Clostridia bacterium]